jgi:hypothetical protein
MIELPTRGVCDYIGEFRLAAVVITKTGKLAAGAGSPARGVACRSCYGVAYTTARKVQQ